MKVEAHKWLDKARGRLAAANNLLYGGYFEDSVSRSYYAMFCCAKALLLYEGIDRKKHSAVISASGKHFAKTGKLDPKYHKYLIDSFDRTTVSKVDREN